MRVVQNIRTAILSTKLDQKPGFHGFGAHIKGVKLDLTRRTKLRSTIRRRLGRRVSELHVVTDKDGLTLFGWVSTSSTLPKNVSVMTSRLGNLLIAERLVSKATIGRTEGRLN